jgi:hypothetical protein
MKFMVINYPKYAGWFLFRDIQNAQVLHIVERAFYFL